MIRDPVIGLVIAVVMLASVPKVRAEDPAPPGPAPEAVPLAPALAERSAPRPSGPEDKDWIFDRGLYTNNPKTGKRVWQYAKKKRAYRDPNSFFDSPHEAYPFVPDPYLSPYYTPYPYYAPYPYYPYPYYGPNHYEPYPHGP